MDSPTVLPKPAQLPQLDVVGGAACLMVLLAHLNGSPALRWVPDGVGAAGVGVFFALSGFLITRILLADRDLLGFYNRRVARIFPIFYLTLAAVALGWGGKETWWAADFTLNFRLPADARDYFRGGAGTPPVAHYWSLCVEEHFYWAWPVLVALLPRRAAVVVPVVVIALTPFLGWLAADHLEAVGWSRGEVDGALSRWTCLQLVALCVGALAAFAEPRLMRPACRRVPVPASIIIGLLLVAAALNWHAADLPVEITRAGEPAALHLLCGGVFLVTLPLGCLGRIRPLTWVGRVSYGAYLYHLPVYAALGLTAAGSSPPAWAVALAIGGTLALAAVSYRFVEAPVLAWAVRRRGKSEAVRVAAAGWAVLTILVAGLCVADLAAAVCSGLYRGADPPGVPRPEYPAEVLVLGASHAEMGVATPELGVPAYNLASVSQDLWYDCEIISRVRPGLPTLKCVVFTVGVLSFPYAISDTDRERWRESLYYHAGGISSRERGADRRRYSFVPAAGTLDSLRAKLRLAADPRRGWNPVTRSGAFDPDSGAVAARRHCEYCEKSGPGRIEENKSLLGAAITRLDAAGISSVIVETPKHAAYLAHIPADRLRVHRAAVADVCRRTQAVYHDFSSNHNLDESHFFDADHLNESGAIAFTHRLVAPAVAHSRSASPEPGDTNPATKQTTAPSKRPK